MSWARRVARGAVLAGGSVLVGLAVMGFDVLPTPLPTASPVVPVPSPSVPSTITSLLDGSSQGSPSGDGGTVKTGPGGSPSAPSGVAGGNASRIGGSAPPNAAAPVASELAAQAIAQSRPAAAGLPVTGGGPGGPGYPGSPSSPSSPPPLAPAAMAGLLVTLLFLGLRMRSAAPVTARRYRMRVEFGDGTGGPAGAAAAAVRCLLESQLPEGTRIEQRGESAFVIEAAVLQRAILGTRLVETATRARRVGLRLDWTAEAERTASAARPRFAVG